MISIIMPVWNRADIVAKSIQSVLSQTFRDYELLIVDDGSEDGLEEAVKQYLSENVFYYRIPHSGVCAARNYGLRRAKGDFIAYLDSDNTWHPDFLSVMWTAINQEGTPRSAAYCMYNFYEKDEDTGKVYLSEVKGEEFDFRKLLARNYIDLNTFIHSKKCIETVGFWDETLKRIVDWDYILRITANYEPVFVPHVLVDYFFKVADNTITAREDPVVPYKTIRNKTMTYKKPVIISHDAITYQWENVPNKKYYNWIKMTNGEFDTSDFAANGYPYMLQIEPTNLCNLACPLCPSGRNELSRERRHMKLNEFKSLIDDMEDYLLFLVLWDWGEPFMNPDLPAMIRYANERDIKTVTSTNGQFLNDESYLEDILTSGLTTLIVAIDSLCEENYEVYRVKGKLNKVLEGLKRLVALKEKLNSKTTINMRMVIMKHNEHELDQMRETAKHLGIDTFTVKTLNPSCGSTAIDEGMVPDKPEYRRYEYVRGTYQRIRADAMCSRVWIMSNIFSNGDVAPCCYDYNGEMRIGNIFNQKFTEIWDSRPYRDLRRKVYLDKNSMTKCRECGINFKLSPTGWFVESLDLSIKNGEALRAYHDNIASLRKLYPQTIEYTKALEREIAYRDNHIASLNDQLREATNEIKDMKGSIVWRAMMKYHNCFVEKTLPQNTRRRMIYDRGLSLGRSLVNKD